MKTKMVKCAICGKMANIEDVVAIGEKVVCCEPKHTPGPWHFLPTRWAGGSASAQINRIWIEGDKTGRIAYVEHHGSGSGNHKYPIDTDYANARLIAAAPELLEACIRAKYLIKTMLEYHGVNKNNSMSTGTLKVIEAAIQKAGGK